LNGPTIIAIEKSDPVQDANKAILNGDYRLISFGILSPGYMGEEPKPKSERLSVIEDSICDNDDLQKLTEYAKLYNKQILAHGSS
jgi:hypothetical protein